MGNLYLRGMDDDLQQALRLESIRSGETVAEIAFAAIRRELRRRDKRRSDTATRDLEKLRTQSETERRLRQEAERLHREAEERLRQMQEARDREVQRRLEEDRRQRERRRRQGKDE